MHLQVMALHCNCSWKIVAFIGRTREPALHLSCFCEFASFVILALASLRSASHLLVRKFTSCIAIIAIRGGALRLLSRARSLSRTLSQFAGDASQSLFAIAEDKASRSLFASFEVSSRLLWQFTEVYCNRFCESLRSIAIAFRDSRKSSRSLLAVSRSRCNRFSQSQQIHRGRFCGRTASSQSHLRFTESFTVAS